MCGIVAALLDLDCQRCRSTRLYQASPGTSPVLPVPSVSIPRSVLEAGPGTGAPHAARPHSPRPRPPLRPTLCSLPAGPVSASWTRDRGVARHDRPVTGQNPVARAGMMAWCATPQGAQRQPRPPGAPRQVSPGRRLWRAQSAAPTARAWAGGRRPPEQLSEEQEARGVGPPIRPRPCQTPDAATTRPALIAATKAAWSRSFWSA